MFSRAVGSEQSFSIFLWLYKEFKCHAGFIEHFKNDQNSDAIIKYKYFYQYLNDCRQHHKWGGRANFVCIDY